MFELRAVSYDHPDARSLTERAQEFYVETYGGPDEDPLTAAELGPPHGGFVVGYLDGRPVAMGGWLSGEHALGDRVAHIRRMFVDAAQRRRGLAAAVLTRLEQDAARHGVTTMVLATGSPQVAAIAFYRRHGYTDIAPFGYYGGSDQVVCLGKDLTPPRGADPQPTS